YASARQKLQQGYYKQAIKQLEALDNYYMFGPNTQQLQLDLIYAYYKLSNMQKAQNLIDRFLRTNANHSNTDYVLYICGLIEMKLDEQALSKYFLFGFNHFERDPKHARAAVISFQQLINNYPHSIYAIDAKKILIYLQNRLANYELTVIEFYSKVGAYVAVVTRVKHMLSNFPNNNATYQARKHMERAYQQLRINSS
ncbi:MAG: outer membrane protein assembly factor BamD, partial [Candidatus Baumannia cicadellinicola]|nr:outer membrane protein assembly factor BamD [Candidatus Baumannia cicadellinicola]